MKLCRRCLGNDYAAAVQQGDGSEGFCDCTAEAATRGGATINESGDHSSIESFVEMCMADEAYTFSFDDVCEVAVQIQKSRNVVIRELQSYGLTYQGRQVQRAVRGFTTSSNDRWYGPGSSKMHGGSGHDQINGFAGNKG
jgi:hypothetical protein